VVVDMDLCLYLLSVWVDVDLVGIDVVVNIYLYFDYCGGNYFFSGWLIYV